MSRICPCCGGIAEYSSYYGTVICTRCNWESTKVSYHESQRFSAFKKLEDNNDKSANNERAKEFVEV